MRLLLKERNFPSVTSGATPHGPTEERAAATPRRRAWRSRCLPAGKIGEGELEYHRATMTRWTWRVIAHLLNGASVQRQHVDVARSTAPRVEGDLPAVGEMSGKKSSLGSVVSRSGVLLGSRSAGVPLGIAGWSASPPAGSPKNGIGRFCYSRSKGKTRSARAAAPWNPSSRIPGPLARRAAQIRRTCPEQSA